jgi:DNA-binding NarL/FixJ family response regulator
MPDPGATSEPGRAWRVLVVDRDRAVASALRLLLGREPGMRVVGVADDLEGALAGAAALRPDAVLLDWELPGLWADGAVPTLRTVCPGAVLIALSTRPERRREAEEAGADTFVSKVDAPRDLLAVLRGARADPGPAASRSGQVADSPPRGRAGRLAPAD